MPETYPQPLEAVVAVLREQHTAVKETLTRIEAKVDTTTASQHELEKKMVELKVAVEGGLSEVDMRSTQKVSDLKLEVDGRLTRMEGQLERYSGVFKWVTGILSTIVGGLLLAVAKVIFGL